MAQTAPGAILQLIDRVLVDPRMRIAPDQELLQRFLGEHNEAAFEALLRRHGPMVLDVCRGVLANEADAEDAFQATFLVLARKAGSIRQAATLASWLHGVAHRTALKARAEATRRRGHETGVPERAVSDPDSLTWAELRRVLHEELARLSERHREPLVLCYLQGKTQDEAAALLGLSKGTLKRLLERGRAVLRERLVRRGLGPAALLLASAWPMAIATAGVPPALVGSTVKAALMIAAGTAATAGLVSAQAAALSQGVLRTMALGKLKTAASLLTLVFLAGVGGLLTLHTLAAQQAQVKQDEPLPTAIPVAGPSNDARGEPDPDRADPPANDPVPGAAAAQPPNNPAGPPPAVPFPGGPGPAAAPRKVPGGPGPAAAPRKVPGPEQQMQQLEQLEQRLQTMEDSMKRLEEKLDRVLKALERNGKPE
jgi:RNA polymerase sigma factor (sigma-70 family)